MKTLGIIAEYNPFHNGHKYHLQKSLEITGASHSIAIISGNFLQRGTPAIINKYERAKIAALNDIDLVLELPFVYATGSASDFSMGAISILNNLNSVDYLCFGAETDDISLLKEVANVVINEPTKYKNILQENLKDGLSFPKAREIALTTYFDDKNLTKVISAPNNILAIEYIAALIKCNSSIEPILIPRISAQYHDPTIYNNISSATAIRHAFSSTNNFDSIANDIPLYTYQILKDNYNVSFPIETNDFSMFLQQFIINLNDNSSYCDLNTFILNKLKKIQIQQNYQSICDSLKSKEVTFSRISRALIHGLVGYTTDDRNDFIKNNYSLYCNILSFRKSALPLIKHINNHSKIPLITKKANFNKSFIDSLETTKSIANRMWELDLKATDIYNLGVFNKFNIQQKNDFTTRISIIDE